MKLLWFFSILFFLFFPSFSLASDFSGRVVAILDGDTIEVLHNRTTERVRLAGIDCPEKKQAFGQRAKQATSTLSFGQQVTVDRIGKDRYGRTLGAVELMDGTNLNYALVHQCWCWWYRKYAPDYAILQALEAEARGAKKGLWADSNPVPPWVWRKGAR
jgi:micrococcal nuclease